MRNLVLRAGSWTMMSELKKTMRKKARAGHKRYLNHTLDVDYTTERIEAMEYFKE